jgi:2-alkenal reductase
MRDRFTRLVFLVLLILVAAFVVQPYVDREFLLGTPRPAEPRGNLAEAERTTIEIFDRVSPSVVQVAALANVPGAAGLNGDGGGVQSGTGFIWDNSRHVVTNAHVMAGTSEIVVRLASGDVVEAMGVAESYDLAVLHIGGVRQLPPAVNIGTSSDLKVGQWAFAIGNPFGLDGSLTTGVMRAQTPAADQRGPRDWERHPNRCRHKPWESGGAGRCDRCSQRRSGPPPS